MRRGLLIVSGAIIIFFTNLSCSKDKAINEAENNIDTIDINDTLEIIESWINDFVGNYSMEIKYHYSAFPNIFEDTIRYGGGVVKKDLSSGTDWILIGIPTESSDTFFYSTQVQFDGTFIKQLEGSNGLHRTKYGYFQLPDSIYFNDTIIQNQYLWESITNIKGRKN